MGIPANCVKNVYNPFLNPFKYPCINIDIPFGLLGLQRINTVEKQLFAQWGNHI